MGSEPTAATQGRVWLLLKNALANLLRALSSSAVAVLLPLLLILILQPQSYAAWALVFSIGTFVVYLDLGVPTTVQAMVGRAASSGNNARMARVTISGLKVVTCVSLFCLLAAGITSVFFSNLFPAVPASVRFEAQIALVIIFLGQTATLVGNTASSYFAGQQRSFVPAAILAPARVASMVAALTAALATSNLIWTSAFFAAPLVLGSGILIFRFYRDSRRTSRHALEHDAHISIAHEYGVKALLRYSGPLMVWGFCILLTTGTGTILVARFDYESIVPFSIATVIVSALAGLSSAASAPLLPELARTHALHGIDEVTRSVRGLSILLGSLLFAATVALLATAPWFLPLLDRRLNDGIASSWWILAVLLVGNTIHLSGTPMSLAFIATKSHTRVILPPVAQALVSFTASIILGMAFGAIGVALGVFIGAILGIVMTFTWSVKLSNVFDLRAVEMLSITTFIPLLKILPALLVAGLVASLGEEGSWWAPLSTLVALVIAYWGLWLGLPKVWRSKVAATLARTLGVGRNLTRT